MSLTTAFISELVWAANQVEYLTNGEKRRLLERAAVTIRDMREQLASVEQDSLADLQSAAEEIERRDREQTRSALLGAAATIRTLRMDMDMR